MSSAPVLFRDADTTFYPTYNARMISAKEVGERFVELPQFEEICQPEHTLILGPRGSGKTTLLKMLLPTAIEAWRARTDLPPLRLPFTAVYVPADTLWVKQLGEDSQSRHSGANEDLQLLVRAAVTTNVLHSLVESIGMLTHERIDSATETLLAKRLSVAWHLEGAFPSFGGLKTALLVRLADIRARSSMAQRRTGSGVRDAEFLHYHFVDLTLIAVSLLDELLGQNAPRLWAICLDEMEILPAWLRVDILGLLRSTNQRLLFKVSGSPLDHTHARAFSPVAANPMSDLTVVKLWYAKGIDGRKFSRRLADLTIRETLRKSVDSKYVLGISPAEDVGPRRERYRPDQPFWRTLRAEAEADPSILDLCRLYGIDPRRPAETAPETRDAFLRKAAPILLLRREYRQTPGHKREMKTRKLVTYYTGIPALLDLADGNPRWLVGMLREILAKFNGRDYAIPPHLQAQVTLKTSKRYKAFLRMLPNSSATIHDKSLTLAGLTDQLGRFFSHQVLKARFSLDPVGSFTVDEDTKPELIALITLGVAQGAFVYCDEDWHTIPDSPVHHRFRLGFLLAPSMKLPLRLNEPKSLRECLRVGMAAQVGREPARLTQRELFGPSEV